MPSMGKRSTMDLIKVCANCQWTSDYATDSNYFYKISLLGVPENSVRWGSGRKQYIFYNSAMARNDFSIRVQLFHKIRCCQTKILLWHGLDNIVIDQRCTPRVWVFIKVKITYFKFFEPSSARSIRKYISIENFD